MHQLLDHIFLSWALCLHLVDHLVGFLCNLGAAALGTPLCAHVVNVAVDHAEEVAAGSAEFGAVVELVHIVQLHAVIDVAGCFSRRTVEAVWVGFLLGGGKGDRAGRVQRLVFQQTSRRRITSLCPWWDGT